MSQPIRVMLVDDHTLFRLGLKMLLEKQEDIDVVCECENVESALSKLPSSEAALVLMDISLPGIDGIEATRRMKEADPSLKVIMLTMHNDEPYLLKALEAGASGYILKEAAGTELISAIRAVISEDIAIQPTMVKYLVNKTLRARPEHKRTGPEEPVLTEREKEVLHYICLGYTNQEIADILVISVKTVEKHKANIAEKLNITRRFELVKYAINKGIICLE